MVSPFDGGEDEVPGEGACKPTGHTFSPVTDLGSSGGPLGPGYLVPHKELTDSEGSIGGEAESIMTATAGELVDTLARTLRSIDQWVGEEKIQRIVS